MESHFQMEAHTKEVLVFIHSSIQSFIHSFVRSFTHIVQKQLAPFAAYEMEGGFACLLFHFSVQYLYFTIYFFLCECMPYALHSAITIACRRIFLHSPFFSRFVFTVSCLAGSCSDWCYETYSAAAADVDAGVCATLSFLVKHILLGSVMNCI